MIVFFIALITSLVFADPTCLNNGLLGPTGNKCYHFISTLQNFDDAEIVCMMFNSVLVSITSGIESNFVLDNANQRFPREYWIGLTDLRKENEWSWMDGQTSNYTNWGSGFPKNDTTKRCVAAQFSGKWMNVNCSSHLASFVCESEPPVDFKLGNCQPNAVEGLSGCFLSNIVHETFEAAEIICAEFGGKLAAAVNAEQATNLTSVAKESFYKTDYWIGVSDPYDSGTWQLVDGTPINFTDWAVGYPENDGISFCVAAHFIDGKWYNAECNNKNPSICQQKFARPSNGWKYWAKTDSYYKGYWDVRGSMFEFEQICKEQCAHLASIHSLEENIFVAATVNTGIKDSFVAIGVYFNSSKKALTWMDGTPWNYEYWYGNKAGYSFECATQMTTRIPYNSSWDFFKCDQTLTNHFVCKKPRVYL